MAQRIKTVQESDLRMLGDLARSIQRVLPVTQADIDAAAALGKGWVVTRVFEVSDPLDNLRGGTQLVIRQNSILPGQSVQRVLIVSGPGGQTVVIRGTDYIVLPDAIADSLSYVKAFGGTEQNGTPTPDTPVDIVCNNGVLKVNSQGQIYTDGTVETINAHGKNLFNKNGTLANGYYKPADGDWVASAAFRTQDYIKASPNTNYALTVTNLQSGGNFLVMSAWDSEHNWLGTVASNTTSGAAGTSITITGIAPTNTAYLSVSVAIDFRDINTLQLEKGSAATEYAPYYDGGTATAEMLLKVGDYQDVQSIIDGVVTRNVGVKVLDGTESFGGGQASGVQCVQITKAALGISSDTLPADSLDLICTHYKAVNGSDWAQSKPNTIKVGSGYLFFNTQYVRDSSSFEAYLADQYAAGTPVIVIYPLATPTTETVTGQTLQVTDGDNVLEITQASLNNLELEAQYQAAVSLTIQEVQDANLDPNVEVTIN